MPYLYDKYQLKLSFDDITTSMEEVRYENGELAIKGSWGVNGLLINHPKIATGDVYVESASVDALMRFGTNWVSLDSTSTASLKDIHFHPRSEEHTSELQSLMRISYAVFCLKKKKTTKSK